MDQNKTIEKHFKCSDCKNFIVIKGTEKQWKDYMENVKNIQDIFPELTPDDRELLITGICGKCFDKIFEGDE